MAPEHPSDLSSARVVAEAGLPRDLRPQALGEQIAEVLAQAIVSKRIPPGAKLSEEELAAQFGTSRTPVRDAFKLLAAEHLVIIMPRRGVRVLDFDGRRIVDIYQIRGRLHGLAAGLAAERAAADQRSDLVSCAEQMKTASAADDLEAFLEANLTFHTVLEAAADNVFLVQPRGSRPVDAAPAPPRPCAAGPHVGLCARSPRRGRGGDVGQVPGGRRPDPSPDPRCGCAHPPRGLPRQRRGADRVVGVRRGVTAQVNDTRAGKVKRR